MGALVGGIAGLESANANAATAKTNAQYASINASDALDRGAVKAGQIQTKGSQAIGQQKAGYAASGIETTSGTPMQTMADTRMMAAHDARTALNNAARESWGYKTQSYGYTQQAQNDYNAGLWSLAGGIVSTEGQAASAMAGGGAGAAAGPKVTGPAIGN